MCVCIVDGHHYPPCVVHHGAVPQPGSRVGCLCLNLIPVVLQGCHASAETRLGAEVAARERPCSRSPMSA